jgi:uncharacterized membrane protein YidH (DUF202 family)
VIPDRTGRGLYNERTALAWTRTGLSMLVVGLATARLAATHAPVLGLALAAIATVVAAAVLRSAYRRYGRTASAPGDGRPSTDGRAVAATAALVLLTGIAGVALILAD